jgi:hypothetical protein
MTPCDYARMAIVTVLFLIGGCSRQAAGPRAVVTGGDAGGVPRSQPVEEHLDAAALEAASRDPAARGLQAFVVLRHGHIVFDRYGRGVDANSEPPVDGFAPVLLALAAGIAVQDDVFPLPPRSPFDPARIRDALESGSHQSYADYLSLQLWRRLNAASAWIDLKAGQPAPADCCFHARIVDWLRVADLLVQDGKFEGKQVVPSGWVARMCQPLVADQTQGMAVYLPPAAHGVEPFELPDVFFLRGQGHWRLWLVPSLRLAVLFGSSDDSNAAEPWDETRLPNLTIRALNEPFRNHDAGSKLQQLVPGH